MRAQPTKSLLNINEMQNRLLWRSHVRHLSLLWPNSSKCAIWYKNDPLNVMYTVVRHIKTTNRFVNVHLVLRLLWSHYIQSRIKKKNDSTSTCFLTISTWCFFSASKFLRCRYIFEIHFNKPKSKYYCYSFSFRIALTVNAYWAELRSCAHIRTHVHVYN